MKEIIERLEKMNIGEIEKEVSLDKYTTYRVGGIASAMVYPKNTECLKKVLQLLKVNNIHFKVVGFGSNLLFSSKRYNGIIIRLDEFNELEFLTPYKLRVGAGYSLVKLSMQAARRGLAGLEFASGIPGTVGGAVFMNAGAYKSDMGYIVQDVTVLTPDLRVIKLENKEMNFHYRTSFLKTHPDYICLEAVLRLDKGNKSAIEEVIKDRRKRRLESQPLNYPSAGSVFRNPEGMSAWKLIDEAGLKGYSIGGAKVSEKHANFIINYDHATGEDIKNLIEYVQEKVKEHCQVELKVEQEFVNWE